MPKYVPLNEYQAKWADSHDVEECELAPPGTVEAVEALRARLAKALAKVAVLESENRALRASRRAALEFLETGDLSEAKEWLGD